MARPTRSASEARRGVAIITVGVIPLLGMVTFLIMSFDLFLAAMPWRQVFIWSFLPSVLVLSGILVRTGYRHCRSGSSYGSARSAINDFFWGGTLLLVPPLIGIAFGLLDLVLWGGANYGFQELIGGGVLLVPTVGVLKLTRWVLRQSIYYEPLTRGG
jgi:hypothetical protein